MVFSDVLTTDGKPALVIEIKNYTDRYVKDFVIVHQISVSEKHTVYWFAGIETNLFGYKATSLVHACEDRSDQVVDVSYK